MGRIKRRNFDNTELRAILRRRDANKFVSSVGRRNFRRDPPQAVLVFEDPVVYTVRQRVIDFISEHKIPTIGENPTWVREGSLLVYGVDYNWYWSRGAYFVDRILKGANPATLPVETPTRIGLYINLKTAKAFGLRIPDSMLATAEEVID
jgi:putative ABC transport system substrate-binding protein